VRLLASTLLFITAAAGWAQTLTVSLTLDRTTLSPGQTAVGTLSLTNSAGNPALFLDGLGYPELPDGFLVDDGEFFAGAPLSLNPGETWTGTAFTLQLDTGFPQGETVQTLDVLGGSLAGEQNVIGTTSFRVNAVPEPATAVILAGLVLGTARRKRSGR